MVLHTTPGTALAIQPGPPLSPAPASSWGVSHKSASVPAFPYDGLIYIPLKTKNKYKLCFHISARCFNKAPFQSFLAVPPKNQGRNEMQSTALPCALFASMPPTQKQNERHGNPGAPMSCSGQPPVAQWAGLPKTCLHIIWRAALSMLKLLPGAPGAARTARRAPPYGRAFCHGQENMQAGRAAAQINRIPICANRVTAGLRGQTRQTPCHESEISVNRAATAGKTGLKQTAGLDENPWRVHSAPAGEKIPVQSGSGVKGLKKILKICPTRCILRPRALCDCGGAAVMAGAFLRPAFRHYLRRFVKTKAAAHLWRTLWNSAFFQ